MTWLRVRGFLRTAAGIIVATVVGGVAAAGDPGARRRSASATCRSPTACIAQLSRAVDPAVRAGRVRRVGGRVGAARGRVRRQGGGDLVVGADLRARRADPTARPGSPLRLQPHQTFAVASGGHTAAAVAAFLVFLLAYTPCVATVAAQRREIGMRWTAFGVGLQLVVAWTARRARVPGRAGVLVSAVAPVGPGVGGPLTAVLAAFDAGAHSLGEVAGRCDLPLDTVRACVDHLVRMGRLEAKQLAVGCPGGGCGSCASGTDDGTAGCGSSAPSGSPVGAGARGLSLARGP